MSFTLLTLPQVTLWDGPVPSAGSLRLEYVPSSDYTSAVKDPNTPGSLVFHVGSHSSTLQPGFPVKLLVSLQGQRTYCFDVKDSENRERTVRLGIPTPTDDIAHVAQDIETLDQLLTQYTDLAWSMEPAKSLPPPLPARRSPAPQPVHEDEDHRTNIKDSLQHAKPVQDADLRGRLVLMDEANGDVVGELPGTIVIQEDPTLRYDPNTSNAVVLEMQPDMYDACTGVKDMSAIGEELLEAREVVVRAVSPEEQDWVMKGATLISQAISGSTSLLLSGITSASNFYIAHSSPGSPIPPSDSPHPTTPPTTSQSALTTAHAMSGKARAVSAKTADIVGGAIARAMGAKVTSTNSMPQNNGGPPPYMTSPQGTPLPYAVYTPRHRPQLPRVQVNTEAEEGPRGPPKMKDKLFMSANLLITTVDDSARRVFDVGTDRLGAVVGHKYGPEAQRSTHLASHTARNVVLIYVDVRGFARTALLKKAGKEFVKARLSGNGDKNNSSSINTPIKVQS
ncbi:hypothetical protein PHLGIDRAFT_33952 [Phlebiopsis gigantea 11061_1 CR5-6]|uniref:Senescence domain-containing protein n=1 Tax=Phlebiopsis gigantea (strain 11061_1 CR5-6) TaxID=745531 RepID=A0A0C3SBS6_PHLG1|nr:hypothetical protein PHLGIDRAFT_33952 [Phlebiopsis gigantea 11061_1 CR5-6]